MLPAEVARCPGEMYVPPAGSIGSLPDECTRCARRIEGIRDYAAGAKVEWMLPPGTVPCSERLEPKK